MTDHELKEKMMKEMIADMTDLYGVGIKYDDDLESLADHLIRAGWRKEK